VLCRQQDAAHVAGLGENFRPLTEPSAPYSMGEQLHVPLLVHREQVDLFHAPH
jgi:hypothetical protein